MTTVVQDCVECGVAHTIIVPNEGFVAMHNGAFVSEAFPNLTAGERELFFLSGICDTCWDILFAEDLEDLELY